MKFHLIMPMCGEGSRFVKQGVGMPKPLINLADKPFFYWSVESARRCIDIEDMTFVVLRAHVDKHQIDKRIKELYPEARIVVAEAVTTGPAMSARMGMKDIDDSLPLMVNDCDHAFSSAKLSPTSNMLLTFKSQRPCYSYVTYSESGVPSGAVEKKVASEDAICGAYIFRDANTYRRSFEKCREKKDFSYLLSELYNEVDALEVSTLNWHIDFGTPESLAQTLGDEGAMSHLKSLLTI